MTTEARPIRDILAECMRRERVGLMRPFWEQWRQIDDAACEQVRLRADHLMRLLQSYGVTLVQAAAETATPTAAAEPIWRYWLVGKQAERVIRRRADGGWEIVRVEDGKELLEQTFTLQDAHSNAGLVLTDDPVATTTKGLGRQLAALTEIYRLDAAAGPAG